MNSPDIIKRLSPNTIIPLGLYVERDADRQLASNVRDMGRPGYVLVARQMGKTNLLIHAKRTLEKPSIRFVYVDLSVVSYHDERECFRQIIDTAIDSHQDVFSDLNEVLLEKRKHLRPANREHDIELRTLLNHANVKLVIILDEIDSLVNADFSDRIFAHIRSVYFSRINYPELERLGYVLSGVVEPNEIIKDKKISPFNIGEKIYLDDFSTTEISQFVSKANLNLAEPSLNRLEYWTGGNPRMLWDICSQLEDFRNINSDDITPDIVDDTVESYYLTNYDHAPVDHIRELVRDNPDIRSAVWTLNSVSAAQLSDAERTKLYLFGITKASSSVSTPKIKNEVIARSLSPEWLKSLASDQRSLFNQAHEFYDRKRYDRALETYQDFLEAADKTDPRVSMAWYRAGMCEYYLSDFSSSLEFLSNAKELTTEVAVRRDLFMGICNFHLENCDASIALLTDALSKTTESDLEFQIQFNLGSAFLKRDKAKDHEEAERIFNQLLSNLSSTTSEKLDEKNRRHLETVAFYNLGLLYEKINNLEKAKNSFQEASKLAEEQSIPAIDVRLADVITDREDRINHLKEAVDGCISHHLWPVENHPEQPLAMTSSRIDELVGHLVNEGLEDQLTSLLDHLGKDPGNQKPTTHHWLKNAGQSAITKGRTDLAIDLLKRSLNEDPTDSYSKLECIGWLLLIDPESGFENVYLDLLTSDQIRPKISLVEMHNITKIAKSRFEENQWSSALEAVRKASRFRDDVDPVFMRNFVGLDLIEMLCLENLGDHQLIPQIAERTLGLWKTLPPVREKSSIFFTDADLQFAREYASRQMGSPPIRLHFPDLADKLPDVGRNSKVSVRYNDGRILRNIKFKQVEEDLKRGRCQLI